MEFLYCFLCGKKDDDSEPFITGKNGCICSNCAQRAAIVSKRESIFYARENSRYTAINWHKFKPHKLKEYLDEFVIGQEEAKKVLAVAVYNHYKRLHQLEECPEENNEEPDVEIEKSNIIIIGRSGVGKTYLLRTIAEKLHVPFCIVDATSLTQAGYVGEDVENILSRLLQNADYDIKAAERGIVYIDEFDKIASKKDDGSMTRDLGEGVQQALLKIIEGADVNIVPDGGRRSPDQKVISINTRNILFICGGAFNGIHSIIKNRLEISSIGFLQANKSQLRKENEEELIDYVNSEDLRAYGIIRELIGRLPIIVHLHPLTRAMLREVLVKPKNAVVKQYQKLFVMDGVKLTFTEDGIDFIINEIVEQKLGARSLRSILEKILRIPMYELPAQRSVKELIIDRAYAKNQLSSLPKSKAGG